MQRHRVVAVWLTICVALFAPAAALAQGNGLPVTPGAGAYLPAAADLGAGWTETWSGGIAPGPELFKEGVKAVYGGPEGARALVFVWITQDSATTTRRAWEATTQLLDSYHAQFADAADPTMTNQLGGGSPPAGCQEASRVEGMDSRLLFPGGLTLCAAGPDVIILAIVSGTLDGAQGHLAADALIEKALNHATAATPAATPTG